MNNADFESLARGLKYNTETEMFQDLYTVKKISLVELSTLLGYSLGTVRRKMRTLGIIFRRPGGPNRTGISKLHDIPDEAFAHVSQLAEEKGLHKSTLFKEKRRRGLSGIDKSRTVAQDQGEQLLLHRDNTEQPRRIGYDDLEGMEGDSQLPPGSGSLPETGDDIYDPSPD